MTSRIKEKIASWVFLIIALSSIALVALICVFLFRGGWNAIAEIGLGNLIFGTEWAPSNVPPKYGIGQMIVGSVYVTLGAIIIGVPIGVLAATFLSRFCPKKLYKVFKPIVELLAGIPSVVYGFFGMVVIVPIVRSVFGVNGYSIFTASLLLGIMILPTIIGVAQASIDAVPNTYYEGALALGATHERAVFSTLLPAAKSGIMAAIVLGVGRAIGETMAVIMVVGNNAVMPSSIFSSVRTLTGNIVLEMGYAADLHREALIATGVVLFAFILIINAVFLAIKRRVK